MPWKAVLNPTPRSQREGSRQYSSSVRISLFRMAYTMPAAREANT